MCENCRTPLDYLSPSLSAESLPVTFLSDYIENRVNNFLTRSGAVDIKVTIRVVSIRDRLATLKPIMKARHADQNGFPYRYVYESRFIEVRI